MVVMKIVFQNLIFEVENNVVRLVRFGGFVYSNGGIFTEVQVCGENKDTHLGVKMVNSSEGRRLRYVSHLQTDNRLEIVQTSGLVEVKTIFNTYTNTSCLQIHTEVKNISREQVVLEEVSAFVLNGLGNNSVENSKSMYFNKFAQSHHIECQPRRQSFFDYGLHRGCGEFQKRLAFANVGSWSTKEELPQGIVENVAENKCLMFQIESNNSWYYEISDFGGEYYLYLGGANVSFGNWSKALNAGETYSTVNVALACGEDVGAVIGEMTKYRRQISKKTGVDATLPPIFNEYMHLSWDSPTAEQTAKVAPIVAKTGIEYYVIDCGWHNEEPGCCVYPYVGQWKESKARFPEGVRKTTDFIRSLGMKAGLWIEPEIIGVKCQEMLDYYDDDCFLQRNGKKIAVMNRYFLDYRNQKVRDYMSETIRRMVEDYGADYIKMDYNEDCGVGTDYMAFCAGEGLEQAANAYLSWIDEMHARFPQVLFETCSSGGMRMDYQTLSHFALVSTSDQTDYLKYPYIAGTLLSAVIPEQAAVWSYPVASGGCIDLGFRYTAEWAKENISADKIVLNMVNSFLGRMHLASHLELMTDEQLKLVTEGVAYYNSLTEAKRTAVPYFPNGFTRFGEKQVVAGFVSNKKMYLAVWCLEEASCVQAPIKEGIKSVFVGYPSATDVEIENTNEILNVCFPRGNQAVFLEIETL